MTINSELAIKMKKYESAYQFYMPEKIPVIIRIDGRAFSKLTGRLFSRSFSMLFNRIMCDTALELMSVVPGASLAYHQSDEISILIINYKNEFTQPWFGNRLDKVISNISAIGSVVFNNLMLKQFGEGWSTKGYEVFDARAFILPQHEVFNYFQWRQIDCRRNAALSFAREYMGQNEANGKSPKELIEILRQKHNVDFYEQPLERVLGNFFTLVAKELPDNRERLKPEYVGTILFDENKETINNVVYSGVLA